MKRKLRVAFLGSGKIGIDLLIKAMRSNLLECVLVSGRNLESDGLKKSKSLGIPISDQGINSILNQKEDIDLVFDATSAMAHKEHWNSLQETNIRVIDMTPSGIGLPVVPAINSKEILNLCALICNSKGVELSEFSRGIPSNTPAQMKRYKNVLELYTSIKKNRS